MPSLFKHDFSAPRRRHLAQTGAAMPGGRFPIESAEDVRNAMQLLGHAPDRAAVVAHIKRRAKAVGAPDPFAKAWSEAARAAAILARRAAGKQAVSAGKRAGKKAAAAAVEKPAVTPLHRDIARGVAVAVPTAGVSARPPRSRAPAPNKAATPAASPKQPTADAALQSQLKRLALLRQNNEAPVSEPGSTFFQRIAAEVKKDWAEFDRQRGTGEKTGRAGGLAYGIFQAPRVGRAVGHVLLRHGTGRTKAIGAGIVAGYAAVRGLQSAGGYIGRKVDEATSRIFQ